LPVQRNSTFYRLGLSSLRSFPPDMMRCLLLATCIPVAAAFTSQQFATFPSGPKTSYDDFLQRHGHRRDATDSVSYKTRQALYHTRMAEILGHNARRQSWVAGVNKFADFTPQELQGILGYKRWARSSRGPIAPSSFLQLAASGHQIVQPKRVASEVDWSGKATQSGKFYRDQGSCGSCWAVATVGALEMHAELRTGNTTQLSYQQLVDCVQNPKHCGGTGGCSGATAELAFEYVHQNGLAADTAYSSGTMLDAGCKASSSKPVTSTVGWHRLPVNQGKPLLMAVAQHGPVVVSVDGGKWFGYESGVFDGCPKDTVINHAVLTIGYGLDPDSKKLYWLIRNSWGQQWGEGGHIRLLRHTDDQAFCGIDNNPKEGVGCDGGPAELPICGMCGVLSDSSYPLGTVVKT